MKPCTPQAAAIRRLPTGLPDDELRIAITLRRPQDGLGLTKAGTRLAATSISEFIPLGLDIDRAVDELHRRGFVATARGRLTFSVRGTRQQFEKVFGTKLEAWALSPAPDGHGQSFYFPGPDAPWNPDPELSHVIDEAYIQWPHFYM